MSTTGYMGRSKGQCCCTNKFLVQHVRATLLFSGTSASDRLQVHVVDLMIIEVDSMCEFVDFVIFFSSIHIRLY